MMIGMQNWHNYLDYSLYTMQRNSDLCELYGFTAAYILGNKIIRTVMTE